MGTYAGTKILQAPYGRCQHEIFSTAPPTGLKESWRGRLIPRLARRGLNDNARFAGFSGTLKVDHNAYGSLPQAGDPLAPYH